jgi:hypothetical protein
MSAQMAVRVSLPLPLRRIAPSTYSPAKHRSLPETSGRPQG